MMYKGTVRNMQSFIPKIKVHLVGFIIRICHDARSPERRDPARKLYDIYHCWVYSEKLLMMDKGTVRNM